MIKEMPNDEKVCEICGGTGKVTVEYPNKEVDNMLQTEEKCECQLQ
jgi:ubiquinone/menaquinone biosynthesis C-methylase UbiE